MLILFDSLPYTTNCDEPLYGSMKNFRALGSFRESQTILKLGKYENNELSQLADHLGASLYKLTVFKTPEK